jgi:hypothetical protein
MRRMRRMFSLLALGCALFPGAAFAQHPGVALRWSHCYGEGTGLLTRSFACDTNQGSEVLVGSFSLASDVPDASGNEIVVDLYDYFTDYFTPLPGTPTPLPEWWKFRNVGTCRQTALGLSLVADPANAVCQDWGQGEQVGAIGAYTIESTLGTGRARIVMAVAVPPTSLRSLVAGVEYFSFNLVIRHDKTVGTGACAGCGAFMYITLSSVRVTTSDPYTFYQLSGPLNGADSDFVTWNQLPVPTRATSWGAVKSLFR